MKKFLSMLAVVLSVGLAGLAASEAEAAKRMGAGKSVGTQRQMTPDKPAAAPAQNNAAAPGAATPSRSWMGPVAGIAAGLGLAALASHFGLGEELASMMLMALVAFVAMAAIAFFMRRRTAQQAPIAAGIDGKAYPFQGNNAANANAPAFKVERPASAGSMIGSGLGGSAGASVATVSIPADFDTAGFERNAKVSFVRLQAAYDSGNLQDIRTFTTPQMFAEVKADFEERGTVPQQFDVGNLHAKVLGVETSAEQYLVSVRFTGFMRDQVSGESESFDEVWNLTKSRQGDSGWLLGGIEQMS